MRHCGSGGKSSKLNTCMLQGLLMLRLRSPGYVALSCHDAKAAAAADPCKDLHVITLNIGSMAKHLGQLVELLLLNCPYILLLQGAKTTDHELRVHRDWIGLLQPVGLVVSPPALLAAQAFPDKNILKEQQALLAADLLLGGVAIATAAAAAVICEPTLFKSRTSGLLSAKIWTKALPARIALVVSAMGFRGVGQDFTLLRQSAMNRSVLSDLASAGAM